MAISKIAVRAAARYRLSAPLSEEDIVKGDERGTRRHLHKHEETTNLVNSIKPLKSLISTIEAEASRIDASLDEGTKFQEENSGLIEEAIKIARNLSSTLKNITFQPPGN